MSYCVNCGVELATEAKKCPLCGCCVINPMEKDKPIEEISEKAWPDEKDNFNFLTQRRFYSFVFTIILCVPMLVCTLANLAYSNTLSWSLYIIGGVITVWIIAVPPILWRHIKTSSFILTDILAALVFTGVIEFITMPGTWFIKMVLPVGTFGLLFSYILSLLIENGKIKGLYV